MQSQIWHSNPKSNAAIQAAMVFAIVALSGAYLWLQEYRDAILNVYFIPIAASAVLLGWVRASGLSLLSWCLVLTITWSSGSDGQSPELSEYFALLAWGCTVGTTGGLIGLFISQRERAFRISLKRERLMASTDDLTGLSNRRVFRNELKRQRATSLRTNTEYVVLMLDVDRFKQINDRYGHLVGDRVLVAIATTINYCVREIDITSRYGGEEFAIILGGADPNAAVAVAERIRQTVANQVRPLVDGVPIQLTVSIGGAVALPDESEASLLTRVDRALYEAKHSGRNQVRFDEQSSEEVSSPLAQAIVLSIEAHQSATYAT